MRSQFLGKFFLGMVDEEKSEEMEEEWRDLSHGEGRGGIGHCCILSVAVRQMNSRQALLVCVENFAIPFILCANECIAHHHQVGYISRNTL
jgi:hypothetical protein